MKEFDIFDVIGSNKLVIKIFVKGIVNKSFLTYECFRKLWEAGIVGDKIEALFKEKRLGIYDFMEYIVKTDIKKLKKER